MTVYTGINLKAAAAQSQDVGNSEILGRTVTRTMRMMMFGNTTNGQWAADRALRAQGIPLREMEVTVNRKGFQYVVGQALRITYTKRGITDVVFRIMNIRESSSTHEQMSLQLLEDADYITQSVANITVDRDGSSVDYSISDLTNVRIMEVPYAVAGEEIQLLPLVGRRKGTEIGFDLYHSFDGTTYSFTEKIGSFTPYGTTAVTLDSSVLSSSKTFNLTVAFSLPADAQGIDTIDRAHAIGGDNLGVLCNGATDEIITFETITPEGVTAGKYHLTNFFRGRYDTIQHTWPSGTKFYFIGQPREGLTNANYLHGTTRYFKLVPYNTKQSADLSEAIPVSHLIYSRAFTPYIPGNFTFDGIGDGIIQPTFTFSGSDSAELFQLMWSPRIRGEAAGLGNPDELTDAYPTYEGYFEIYIYNGATLAATSLAATGFSLSYTEGAIRTAVGFTPDNLTVKIRNSILTSGTIYSSEYRTLNATRT